MAREVADSTLGGEFDKNDRAELQSRVEDADEAAKDEAWGEYRVAINSDAQESDGLEVIDLGAGDSSSGKTQCGRVIEALNQSGAWPLASLARGSPVNRYVVQSVCAVAPSFS